MKTYLGIFLFICLPFSQSLYANDELFLSFDWRKTSQPIGHYEFCKTQPEECRIRSRGEVRIWDENTWAELQEVNTFFNISITPMLDIDNYGIDEIWSYADNGKGDCEDYAMEKRRALIELGWPPSSLLFAVVFQLDGSGHAVLLARTTRGDFILDNLEKEILLWWDVKYDFKKIQSPYHSGQWRDVTGLKKHRDRKAILSSQLAQ